MRYKKLFTRVESHASAVSLLKSREYRYIKVTNNNNNTFGAKLVVCVCVMSAVAFIVRLYFVSAQSLLVSLPSKANSGHFSSQNISAKLHCQSSLSVCTMCVCVCV